MNNFTKFAASAGLSNLADGISAVAWAWLASLLTRDALLVALVPVVLRAPWFLCALPAGVVTDRVSRLGLIRAMDGLRAASYFGLTVALLLNGPLDQTPQTGLAHPFLYATLLLAAACVGVAEVFRDNAAQTMLPALVPSDRLEQANGRLWSVELVGNALLGPALGAFLIAAMLFTPFAVNALACLAAMWLLRALPNSAPPARRERNWKAELKEGFAFLGQHKLLRQLAWITGFWNLLYEMSAIALVLHVQENLNLGARSYGLILAAGALGGILGGWCGPWIIGRMGQKRTAQVMLALSAPAFAGMVLAKGPIGLALVLAAFSFTGLVWNTVSVSYRQRMIPDALLGRVNSIYRMMAWGMMPVGLILSGLLVQNTEAFLGRQLALGVPFWASAIGAAVLGIAGWRALSRGFSS
ncbi:MFS transporter [Sulfitobacter donghicola]|uniref:MFS transporter n=1 Tax=Sulfitobacter donghicola DSW-25 = KCTC 12864 = JCM 14565 TaxID=1300350 RepID=A0A073IJX3_9RHOB|nr:MFS transporter [Sulfitobacter donghicola]KEJ90024.1 MFS transporter [Sulfitobacter donghicola DSW-25 = KCTC 12864 = JCM 14565]KIN66844.1 Major facilitator superfamily protein [Sulfitobacter donghicola DSW-25 = KCTC 12864 = JCM 14565]